MLGLNYVLIRQELSMFLCKIRLSHLVDYAWFQPCHPWVVLIYPYVHDLFQEIQCISIFSTSWAGGLLIRVSDYCDHWDTNLIGRASISRLFKSHMVTWQMHLFWCYALSNYSMNAWPVEHFVLTNRKITYPCETWKNSKVKCCNTTTLLFVQKHEFPPPYWWTKLRQSYKKTR